MQSEKVYAAEFLLDFDDESVDSVTVLSGQNLTAGAVVGEVLRVLAAAPNPVVTGTGNGTMTNVRPGPRVKAGNYVVKCTAAAANGGTFSVTDPDGEALPALVLAAGTGAYASDQINFTITDGATDFAVNDTFTIAVTAGATPAAVGTGNGAMSALSIGPLAQNGTYRVVCTGAAANGGTFSVTAPDGSRLPDLAIAAGTGVYASEHVNFTITDGAADFAAGDHFHVVVARPSTYGQVAAYNPTVYDGRHIASGLLFADVDASAAAVRGSCVKRDAIANSDRLAWAAAITGAQKETAYEALERLGIVIR